MTVAGIIFDLALIAIAVLGWRRAFAVEREAKREETFYDALPRQWVDGRKPRSGISLLEVLIALFVLSIGVLGVAALIPLGKINMLSVEKSDRTGACGRAALSDIKIRGLLDFTQWSRGPSPGQRVPPNGIVQNAFAIDPLGYAHGLTGNLGPIQRLTMLARPTPAMPALGTQLDRAAADEIFSWHDDLVFAKNGTERPTAVQETVGGTTRVADEGSFTWLFTINPTPGELTSLVGSQQSYSVSVAVIYKRDYDTGERVVNVTDFSGGVGGGSVEIDADLSGLQRNEWVLLCGYRRTIEIDATGAYVANPDGSPKQIFVSACKWYRAVSIPDPTGGPRLIGLAGPDWDLEPNTAATPITLVWIDGVTGVYSSTMPVTPSD